MKAFHCLSKGLIAAILTMVLVEKNVVCQEILDYKDPILGPEELTIDNFSGLGARAMGMGGAYIAVAEDFSATYWNPAGLAQIKQIELCGGLLHQIRTTDSGFYKRFYSEEISKTWPGSFGVVLPVPTERGSLVFALGYNQMKNFDLSSYTVGYNPDFKFQQEEEMLIEGGLGAWSIAGAIDVSPSVSVGATINFWDGENDLSWESTLIDAKQAHADLDTLYGYLDYHDEYDGTNLKIAAIIKGKGGLRFGATICSPVTHEVKKDWEDKYKTVTADSTFTWDLISNRISYKVRLPYEFGFGASWSHPNLTLALDAHYTDWKQTEYKNLPSDFGTSRDFRIKYKDAWRLYFGGEFLLPLAAFGFPDVKLRGGFSRDPITYIGPRSQYASRIEVINQRNWITFGAGTLIDGVFSIDLAWVHGTWEQTEGRLEQEHKVDRFFVTGSYRF